MTTLALGITATSTILNVSDESLNVALPFYVTIEDEVMRVRGFERVSGVATRWNVDRGVDSTPATHTGGTAIALGDSAGGGAAALSLDNTIDPPADITSLVAAGATVSGSEATLRGKDFYAQDTDPGAVGAGSVWKDTASSNNFWERNAADDGWDARFVPTAVAAADAEANVGILAVASGFGYAYANSGAVAEEGDAVAGSTATTAGGLADARSTAMSVDGDALADSTATASGAGDASAAGAANSADGVAGVRSVATTTAGLALAGSLAVMGAASAGMSAEVDVTSARMAFNGTTPIAIPVLPATPDAQDIADVLVALGLATQTP